MVIKVVGKKLTKYRVVCSDTQCCSIIECDSSDIKLNTTYSMGRECGSRRGIVCPKCDQVLDIKDFIVVGILET